MQMARQEAGSAVLVHHSFHAHQAVALPGHGYASAAAGDHHDARLEQARDGFLFHDAQWMRGGHHAAPLAGRDFGKLPVRPAATDFLHFGGGVKTSDGLGGMDHAGVALADQHLGDDGGRGTPDALAAEQFEEDPLDYVPHAAL